MLTVDDLHVRYGAITAVRGVSIHVEEDEIVGLIGVNGAGKTTTLSAIAGIVRPTQGTIRFQGQPLAGRAPEQIVRMGIAMTPEGRDIFPSLTVEENLRLGAFIRGSRAEFKHDLDEIFGLFPILSERFSQVGGTLSGGEQQQLAIARSLMSHPKLLMLDEPSLGLAPALVDQIFELIVALRKRGVTILLVEQNVDRTLEIADRVYLLNTGQVEVDGTPAQLKAHVDIRGVYLGANKRRERSGQP